MSYYCLECDKSCDYQYCPVCEDNPKFLTQEHPGFISSEEIESEIQTENSWYEYDQR